MITSVRLSDLLFIFDFYDVKYGFNHIFPISDLNICLFGDKYEGFFEIRGYVKNVNFNKVFDLRIVDKHSDEELFVFGRCVVFARQLLFIGDVMAIRYYFREKSYG